MADQTPRKEKYSEIVAREKLALEKQEEVAKRLPGKPIRNSEEWKSKNPQNIQPIEEIVRRPMESAEHEIFELDENPREDEQMTQMQNMHQLTNILNRANAILAEGLKIHTLDDVFATHLINLKAEIKELAFSSLLREHTLFGEMFDEQTN